MLERRLRLGIGGYLSSRGLRLRDLESASLTAPDDDPAMGQIWEALIGPEDGGHGSVALDYRNPSGSDRRWRKTRLPSVNHIGVICPQPPVDNGAVA